MILSIIILNYDTPDLVLDCVSSIRKQYQSELDRDKIEIIVVDNASSKEIVDEIEDRLKGLSGIRLIKNKENLGFGSGCNEGVGYAGGEFVLFLNSDTEVFDRAFLGMTEFLKKNQKVGILGGRLLNSDGNPQASVGKFYNLVFFFIMLFGGERFGLLRSSPDNVRKVDWVSGACMMVNKKTFEQLSGFDKNIFMYTEDMELCFRAKKKGILTYYYPNSEIGHKQLGSSNRTFAVLNIYKGILYFYKKHKSKLEYCLVWFLLFLKAMGIYLLGRLTNNSYYIKTYGQALRDL